MKTFRFRKTTTSEIASKIMSVKRRKGRYELKLENGKTYFLPQETLPKDVAPAYGDIFALGFCMDMITIIRLNDRIVFELTPEQLVEKLENNCKLLANIIRKQEEKAISLQNQIEIRKLPALLQLWLAEARLAYLGAYAEKELRLVETCKKAFALYRYFQNLNKTSFSREDDDFINLIRTPNNEIWPNPGNESYPLVCEAADLANRMLADVFDNGIGIFDRNDCLRRKQHSATLGYRTEEMKKHLATKEIQTAERL